MPPAAMSGLADLVIRLARPEERKELEALQRRASLALGEYNEQLEAEPDAVQLPIEQIERGQVIVADLADRIAGFAAVLIDDDRAELDGLFVEPALWKRGVGSALVDVAVHEARRQGLAMMVIANPSARPFYEKCGFTLEGEAQTRFGPALRMSR
jgi:GNAT superfamily N-acetyltransferase